MEELKSLEEVEKFVAGTTDLIVLHFYGEHCHPCKKVQPNVDAVYEQLKNAPVKFARIEFSKNLEIMQHFSVMGVPAIVLIRNNKEVSRFALKDLLNQSKLLALLVAYV